MRCEEADSHIAEYVAGRLAADSPFRNHLAECARCRNEVRELREIWADLDEVRVPKVSAVMQPRLLATIAGTKLEISNSRRTPMPYLIKPILTVLLSTAAAWFLGHSLVQPLHEAGITVERPAANSPNDYYRGDANAPLTLVEYGDYECPPCATYNPVVNEVLKRYAGQVKLEYRHFAMTRIHPNALLAAAAAEAAGKQGHYWEMHDLLLMGQQRWAKQDNPEQFFVPMAASIGLDSNKFLEDLRGPEVQARIVKQMAETNIQAVPAFFINGHQIQVQPNIESFVAAIDAELKK
jgi:protein-disulfide isomerase